MVAPLVDISMIVDNFFFFFFCKSKLHSNSLTCPSLARLGTIVCVAKELTSYNNSIKDYKFRIKLGM